LLKLILKQFQVPAGVVTDSFPSTLRSHITMERLDPPNMGGGGGPGAPAAGGGGTLLVDRTMLALCRVSPAFIPAGYSRIPSPPVTLAELIFSACPSGSTSFMSSWNAPPVHLIVLVDVLPGTPFLSNICVAIVAEVTPPLVLTLDTVETRFPMGSFFLLKIVVSMVLFCCTNKYCEQSCDHAARVKNNSRAIGVTFFIL